VDRLRPTELGEFFDWQTLEVQGGIEEVEVRADGA
jgi:hypothetical protein